MANVDIRWNMARLGRYIACHPETVRVIDEIVTRTAATANSMGAGNPSGSYHCDHKSPSVGGTAPKYDSNTKVLTNSAVGIVYSGNYAARRDNLQNNTLLKALG